MKKALVVDDSDITRKLISKMLAKFGFDIIQAKDGMNALEELKSSEGVELAFVDWNMPVMSGIELLKSIRDDSRFKSLKVVMVTGNLDMKYVELALQEGADEYIMLPLNSEILEEKLALIGVYPETN